MQYYQIVFSYLNSILASQLESALRSEPKQHVESALKNIPKNTILEGQEGWNYLRIAIDKLEISLKGIIEKRSSLFWIYTYRRIGLHLHVNPDDNIDSMTLLWVRSIVESSIFKFGDNSSREYFEKAKNLSDGTLMGGLFLEAMGSFKSEPADKTYTYLTKFLNALLSSEQVVFAKFERKDFVDIHRIEGIAYEYWRMTAQLRAMGKGAKYIKKDKLGLQKLEDKKLWKLIRNYDNRIDNTSGFASSDGQILPVNGPTSGPIAMFMSPNVSHAPPDFLRSLGVEFDDNGTTNYFLSYLNLYDYYAAHQYSEKIFYKKRGFHLESTLRFLLCSCYAYFNLNLASKEASEKDTELNLEELIGFHQRAYKLIPRDRVSIEKEILTISDLMDTKISLGDHNLLKDEISLIGDSMFLSESNSDHIGLWSGGPRFPFIPFYEGYLLDLSALPYILRGLFFGMRTGPGGRGEAFEDQFRGTLENEEFSPYENRLFKNKSGNEREVDAFIELAGIGYLFECKSTFRPFVYELTDIKTQIARDEELEGKLEQAESAKSFLMENKKGANYDITHIKRIEHFVVSPFEEWIWSSNKRYWYKLGIPRIISAEEAINVLQKASENT